MVQAREVVFGRTRGSTVQVVHPLVSRRHARLLVEPTGLMLEDLGSANGTWLNGVRCSGATRVLAGDELSLGREGAGFVLIRAVLDGRDISVDDEEDEKTLVAGDPRAMRIAARVAVSPSALPEPPEVSDDPEAPTRAVNPADLDRTRAAAPHERLPADGVEIPTVEAATPESSIPVIDEYVSDSEYHDLIHGDLRSEPATIPVERPGSPRSPGRPAASPAPAPERPRSTPKTEPAMRAPTAAERRTPPTAPSAGKPTKRRVTRGWTAGILLGLLLGIVAAAAAAVYTDLPERLAEFDRQRVDAGGPR